MKRAIAAGLAVLLIAGTGFFATGCAKEAVGAGMNIPRPEEEILSSFDPELAAASNEFGLKVLQELMAEKEENIFISPTSIYTALAMTYNGAGSETREAMAEVLGIKEVDLQRFNENNLALLYLLQEADPEVIINIANSLWMREEVDFEEDFVEKNKEFYNALTKKLNFDSEEAVDIINRWVKETTGGLIEEIVEYPIDPLTILFLINAVYFQGDWTEAFDPDNTRKDTFYSPEGEIPGVPLMYRSDEMEYLEKEGEFQAVRLPYGKEERVAMYVFLPAKESSLRDLVAGFNTEKWGSWQKDFREIEGTLFLPRFKMEYEKTLNDVLRALGMEIAFDEDRADFFDMVPRDDGPRLYISEVKHKSFIEVDEKGTEAAAATSVEIRVESAPLESFNMKVDRPFFFLIHDRETGEILFNGTIVDPAK